MFFGPKHFEKEFGEHAELIAALANQVIDKNGYLMYGRLYADGTCEGFSTTQEDTDTHVCAGIGMQLMGTIPDLEQPIQQNYPDLEDELRALRARNAQLERMNNGNK